MGSNSSSLAVSALDGSKPEIKHGSAAGMFWEGPPESTAKSSRQEAELEDRGPPSNESSPINGSVSTNDADSASTGCS